MAGIYHHADIISAKDRMWHSLLYVTKLLSEGADLEELVRQSALNPGLKKRKRSPRNQITPFENPRHPIIPENPETSRDQSLVPRSPVLEKSNLGPVLEKSNLDFRDDQMKRNQSPGTHTIKFKLPRHSIIHENPGTSRDQSRVHKSRVSKKPNLGPVSEKPDPVSARDKKTDEAKCRVLMENHIVNGVQNLHPDLPVAIRARIIETGGSLDSAAFIIEKKLYTTDVNKGHCRLSIPVRQVKERFLMQAEVDELLGSENGIVPTTLIDPCFDESEVAFSLWKSNTMYALKSGWKDACIKNGLTDKTTVRLWAFRRESKLCLALERI
ncbi:hypothetical protein CASFOL_021660 [Castilleja foliolosa]|uniref:B3 domain-containing protein n=1 Tax=Castilleja foliolosa TaxID=1961234 RepID=A0ABD3CZ77_9LAMI